MGQYTIWAMVNGRYERFETCHLNSARQIWDALAREFEMSSTRP